jgi:hypothetical protein
VRLAIWTRDCSPLQEFWFKFELVVIFEVRATAVVTISTPNEMDSA